LDLFSAIYVLLEKENDMSRDNPDSHTYGTPAPEKQLPPPTEGLRGEGSSTILDPAAEQQRPVKTAEGHKVIVAEDSGTAFAESEGAGSRD
jgi:hypothetical protein